MITNQLHVMQISADCHIVMENVAVIRYLSKPFGYALVNSQGHEHYHEFNMFVACFDDLISRFRFVFGCNRIVAFDDNTFFVANHISSVERSPSDVRVTTTSNIMYAIPTPTKLDDSVIRSFASVA